MDKILDIILLFVLALGSAVLFSFTMLWKFVQAMFELILASFSKRD